MCLFNFVLNLHSSIAANGEVSLTTVFPICYNIYLKLCYLTWWDNKTENNEVFFAAINDGGKTFDKAINLSNAKGGSADSQITAQGNNVYVSWWDNKTGDWQVFSKASNDNGKTFGDAIMLKSIGNSPIKTLKAPPSNTISVDTIVSASGNNEYAVWWDNTIGNWEVSFAKSSDG
jgi:hypothetical protein